VTDIELFAFVIVPVVLAALGWAVAIFYRWWLKNHPDG